MDQLLTSLLDTALDTKKTHCGPITLSARKWKRLYNLAKYHLVEAMALGELQKAGNNMPQGLNQEWREMANSCIERFYAQLLSLSVLNTTLEAEGVKILALKGCSFAFTYPKAQYRKCADIDIYPFGDYEKVHDILSEGNLCKSPEESSKKHSCLEVYGIEVENHRNFTDRDNKAEIIIDDALKHLSGEAPLTDPRTPGILFPSATMGALHAISHTLIHLAWSGILLRHLCDVTAYFRYHKDEIDMGKVRLVLTEAGMEHGAAVLLKLCKEKLGLETDLSEWTGVKSSEMEEMYKDIVTPLLKSSQTRSPLRKFNRKRILYRHRKKYYRVVYGQEYDLGFGMMFAGIRKRNQARLRGMEE